MIEIAGLPARLPFRDERLLDSGKRDAWLKLGGREELRWMHNFLLLYWEVRTEQENDDDRGLISRPRAVYVCEWSHGAGTGTALFDTLDRADRHMAGLERDNMIEIAAAALGIR